MTLQVLELMTAALETGAGKAENPWLAEADGLERCLERSVGFYDRGMICEAIDLLGDVCFRKYENGLEGVIREKISPERASIIGKRIALLAEGMHRGVEVKKLRQELSIVVFALRISAMQVVFSAKS